MVCRFICISRCIYVCVFLYVAVHVIHNPFSLRLMYIHASLKDFSQFTCTCMGKTSAIFQHMQPTYVSQNLGARIHLQALMADSKIVQTSCLSSFTSKIVSPSFLSSFISRLVYCLISCYLQDRTYHHPSCPHSSPASSHHPSCPHSSPASSLP